jgi:bacillithiol system protein YtxJ
MNWKILETESQLEEIAQKSFERPQVIFKHSTRCSISHMAKSRLERSHTPENFDFHYLDLIAYRPVSNKIVNRFGVDHESPQILLIRNGECIFDESHNGILMDDILEAAR